MMNPLDSAVFGTDPWWIVLIKVLGLVVFLLVYTIFNVWFERRVVGKMQQRKGPIMNGPFGLAQALADGVKLLFKEDFRPKGADKVIFTLAPIITGTAAFTAWSVIPLGGEVSIFGVKTNLQLTDLPMGVLFILSISAIGIYGIVLAGWSSSSEYSLVGAVRSTAQMISYEIAMGLSLVAVFLYAGSMSTADIVSAQAAPIGFLPGLRIPGWYGLLLIPSFIIYVISMIAETNRAPFDLVECEQELVSGYITDYSGFRYAIYFLAEYINMATVSAVATTLFLGGYHAPWPLNAGGPFDPNGTSSVIHFLDSGWMGPVWFIIKVQCFIFLYVWLRGTLPRLRYDQFMHMGWKVLIPVNLLWIVLVACIKAFSEMQISWLTPGRIGIAGVVVLAILIVSLFIPSKQDKEAEAPPTAQEVFDPFAGGYPVPPMPGQILPEYADVLVGPDGDLMDGQAVSEEEE